MGKRKKKNKDGGPAKRQALIPMPLPDDRPNWSYWDRHEVMMSVSMEFKPINFENEFLAVICPVAKRRTVVAYDGWTCSYNKLLNMDRKFQSVLPGGNIRCMMSPETTEDQCVLDCLHYKSERIFFILDLMMWNRVPYYDAETDFRFQFIDQLERDWDLRSIHPENEYQFIAMPRVRCYREHLYAALRNTKFKVDGILFFHRGAVYTPGSTNNVLWLPPEDIEKVLGWKPPQNVFPSINNHPSAAASTSASFSGFRWY